MGYKNFTILPNKFSIHVSGDVQSLVILWFSFIVPYAGLYFDGVFSIVLC